jgi:hypothetical protein
MWFFSPPREGCIQRSALGWRFPVPLDARVLEILCCPSCRGTVGLLPDGDGLECVSCGRIYPILDGIPVMLIEESRLPGK